MNTVARIRPQTGPSRDHHRGHPAIAHVGVLERRVEQHPRAGVGDESFPDDLEMVGEVGDARPGAVRVRSLDDRAETAQSGDDVIADPPDDLARLRSRRVEAIEGVEDRGAGPTQEGQPVDQQDRGSASGRRDRSRGSSGACPTTQTSTEARSDTSIVTLPAPATPTRPTSRHRP